VVWQPAGLRSRLALARPQDRHFFYFGQLIYKKSGDHPPDTAVKADLTMTKPCRKLQFIN
jgi:hypothetical protein